MDQLGQWFQPPCNQWDPADRAGHAAGRRSAALDAGADPGRAGRPDREPLAALARGPQARGRGHLRARTRLCRGRRRLPRHQLRPDDPAGGHRRRLAEHAQQLEQLAMEDALTGLFNRRYLEEAANRELQRAERNEQQLAVMVQKMQITQ